MSVWRWLQLADSAFPMGGFAHSNGLEAAYQAGETTTGQALERTVREVIEQAGQAGVPLVVAAFDTPEKLVQIDRFAKTTIWSHVAARASRAQGRALLDAAGRIFGQSVPLIGEARAKLRGGEIEAHFAPVHGLVAHGLELTRVQATTTFLHVTVRGVLSAAVRLGIVGPFEAQSLQERAADCLARVQARSSVLEIDDVAQTAPLLELFQTTHDRLYARLFQS